MRSERLNIMGQRLSMCVNLCINGKKLSILGGNMNLYCDNLAIIFPHVETVFVG